MNQEDTPANVFQVVAPEYPFFHPKDSTMLVDVLKADVQMFQFFDWRLGRWVYGSLSSPARNVKTSGELHYRSIGVQSAPDMPSAAMAEPVASATQTPQRSHKCVLQDDIEYGRQVLCPCVLLLLLVLHMLTVSHTRFGVSIPQSKPIHVPPTPPATESPQGIISSPASMSFDSQSWTTPSSDPPPLPALFASTSTAASESSPLINSLEWGPAPRGRSGWPLKYVVDVATGFATLGRLEDSGMDHPSAFCGRDSTTLRFCLKRRATRGLSRRAP